MSLKVDSIVVETKTKFPTDYGLLWDSIRKSLKIIEKLGFPKWRKSKSWKKELKSLMRSVGMISSRGGKHKPERLKKSLETYLKKTIKLKLKIEESLESLSPETKSSKLIKSLEYFYSMLLKHMDLVERRILKGERIPHEEKIVSIFQPFVEMINKGKRNVEIGKKVSITTDKNNLILDWRICKNESDSEIIVPTIKKLKLKYKLKRLIVDKGYSSKSNKEELSPYVEELIMAKKGKLNKKEKSEESQAFFIKYRKKHNGIESNINELEHRGLDKCPDRTEENFIRYVGLCCIAYNLHKIGQKMFRNILKRRKKKLKSKQSA